MIMKNVVYLASFKGTHKGWKGWFNRLIRWATKGPYSHSEVCVGHPFESEVLCVSSVGTEGGVRGKVQRLDPADWDIVPMIGTTEKDVFDFLKKCEGAPYDLIGCLRTVLPFVGHEHPVKWFCSEVAAAIYRQKEGWRFHPNAVHPVIDSRNQRVAYVNNKIPSLLE